MSERTADDDEAHRAAVISAKPFVRGGRVYVHKTSFRQWLAVEEGERVASAQINVWLKRLAFVRKPESVRRSGSGAVVTRQYWSAAVEDAEEGASSSER